MNDNSRTGPQFHWLNNVNLNMNDLQQRLVQENNLQRHVGQVVRGVIPAGPQYDYHPNPYLQHLYHRQQQGAAGVSNSPGPDSTVVNIGLDDIDAQLSQLVAEASRDGNMVGSQQTQGDVNQNDAATHTHTHGHTHARRRNISERLDWKILLSSGSFAIILFLRLMADHILGLLMFIALSAVFYYSNLKMVEIVHITSLREHLHVNGINIFLKCTWLICFLFGNIACIYYVFNDQELWRVLCFQLPSDWQGTMFDLFWVSLVTDSVLRFGTIILKSLVAVVPQICLPQKRKGKYYMFIEVVSQIYRSLVPIVPWVHFLYDQPKTGRLIFAGILLIVYLLLKAYGLYLESINLRKAVARLKSDTTYGTKPSAEEIKTRGESCPICQDDYQDPIMLACKHIFCENCVSVWFDREKTCPMCRAEIQTDDPKWRDGSTSSHLQWY